MLKDLRDQKNSALIVILFAVIILVFIFMFGLPSMDSMGSKSQSDVAHVNDHRVTYDMMRTMILNQYDDNIFGTAQYPGVARQVAEGIGVIYLLADEARNAGLRVSDEELQDYITNWESGNSDVTRLGFLHKNEFSQRNYNDALRRMQLSARDYEDYKREELLARRYLLLLSSSIAVSDASLWSAFAEANETASLEVVRLTPDSVGKTFKPLSDEEVSAFVGTGMADIQAYYDKHIAEYTTPAKVKLHQIVIQKSLAKLDHPGAKTIKTYQAAERFSIARAQASEEGMDFAQAYTDYDESEDKELAGVSGLLPIEMMADELQTAIGDKKTGELLTAEMSDRYIIAKILDRTEQVVTPVDDVKNDIARKILNERRIKSRTDEITSNILAQAASKPLADLVNDTMYVNVLAEKPTAPAAEVGIENADGETPDSAEGQAPAVEPAAPAMVALPTDLPIIPAFDRVKAQEVKDIQINTGFLQGLGVNEDLARDIRSAAANTVLPKAYTIGLDTLIVKVVDKTEADRAQFDENLASIRENAIAAKSEVLIGNIEDILSLKGSYGLWVEQKIQEAGTSGKFRISNDYFAKMAEQIKNRRQGE